MNVSKQWQRLSRGWQRVWLLVGGALTTLSFAPFFWLPVLWITLPLWMIAVRQAATQKQAFGSGWWFGAGYFGAGLYWIAHALLIDAAMFGWLIPFATVGMSSVLAVYIGIASLAAWQMRRTPWPVFLLACASLWVSAEILRGVLFTGFPWNPIGASLALHPATLQGASLGGIWWLSWLVVMLAGLPLLLAHRHKYAAGVIILIVCMLLAWGWQRVGDAAIAGDADGVMLRVVQANIKQELKWDSREKLAAIDKHINMSGGQGADKVTHIVWSESAMTLPFRSYGRWAYALADIVPEGGALITGGIRFERVAGMRIPLLYNSVQAVTSEAEIIGIYDKRHRVPFGEYVPLRQFLPFIKKITHGMIDFSAGGAQPPLALPGAPDADILICYEAIFPWLVHDHGAEWLINVTNDGWFGYSTGPHQHFHMSRIRAVEQGVPLVRAANTGISGVIDSYGQVRGMLALGEESVLDRPLPAPALTPPFYARYPMVLLMVTLAGSLLLCWVQRPTRDA